MKNKSRKGFDTSQLTEDIREKILQTHSADMPTKLSIISYHGSAGTVEHDLDPLRFEGFALFSKYSGEIHTTFFEDATPGSKKNYKARLAYVEQYFCDAEKIFQVQIDSSDKITKEIAAGFLYVVSALDSASIYTSFYLKLLRTIGVSPTAIPPNPFPSPRRKQRDSQSIDDVKASIEQLRTDAELVRKRYRTLKGLRGTGRLPTSDDEWGNPANQLFVLENIIGLPITTEKERRDRAGVRKLTARLLKESPPPALQARKPQPDRAPGEGAQTVQKLNPNNGLIAHMKWFYPGGHDLLPFFGLLMRRTPFNAKTIADAQQNGRWHRPFPLRYDENEGHDCVYIELEKIRGRLDRMSDPSVQTVISPIRRWSYPYQVLEFVKVLTSDLRDEVKRQKNVLLSQKNADAERLDYLSSIENDLFLYKTTSDIYSFRNAFKAGGPEDWLRVGLKFYGLSAANQRGDNINYIYNLSGNSLLTASFLAGHQRGETTAEYIARQIKISSTFAIFKDIFDRSLQLIKASAFSVENLIALLEIDGFTRVQAETLASGRFRTRWGNDCADPRNPPRGFNQGTPRGGMCYLQNCIDGCPRARWLRDSTAAVIAMHQSLCHDRDTRSGLANHGSSIHSRIERCELIIAAFQKMKNDANSN